MHRFCNGFFTEFGESYTLLNVYNISKKLELAHAHYEANTMRPPHVQGFNLHQLRQPDHHIFQGLKRCTWLHSSYLLATIMAILPTKVMSATSLPRISFVIIVGKRDIMKLSILPSSWNGSNSDYHGKIYQHLMLPLNQKPRHLNL